MMCTKVVILLSLVVAPYVATTERSAVCPSVEELDTTQFETRDPVKRFSEISGLGFSPTLVGPSGKPILYGIADGGIGPRLGAWDSGSGERLITFRVPTVENYDWESLDVGSCGGDREDKTCLYVAELGDNTARVNNGQRSSRDSHPYMIIKIEEPPHFETFVSPDDNVELPDESVRTLTIDFLDSTSPTDYADSEALFLDHTGWGDGNAIGDLYIATKWNRDTTRFNRLFKVPVEAWSSHSDGTSYSMKVAGSYNSRSTFISNTWTSASMTLDGTVISLGTNSDTYMFLRCPGATVAESLAGFSCRSFPNFGGQMESNAWTPDGQQNLQIPEGSNVVMGWAKVVYDADAPSVQVCPNVQYDANGNCRSGKGFLYKDAWCDEDAQQSAPVPAPVKSSNLRPTAVLSMGQPSPIPPWL